MNRTLTALALAIPLGLTLALAGTSALAQRPDRPPQSVDAPPLPYQAVPQDEVFNLPDGMQFAGVAALAYDEHGDLVVLHRGDNDFLVFDRHGDLVRAFGDDLYTFSHGLRIDDEGHLWATDAFGQIVQKLSPDGEVLMTLGTRGEPGSWDEEAGTRLLHEPNDVAFGPNGDVYIAQGHGRGEPKILRFDRDGNFLMSWGGRGEGPGEFAVAHSVVIDDDDIVYVADRENHRIQLFDLDGLYLDEWTYEGMPCGLYLHGDYLYMTTGFDGEVVKVDKSDGTALGAIGGPGDGLGEFGEAHFLVISPHDGAMHVADVVGRKIQTFVPTAD